MGLVPASQADTLAARLGYVPRDRALLVVALTHRSAEGPNNERLEFLGDSVLNLLLSERLYREFPTATEGDLPKLLKTYDGTPETSHLRELHANAYWNSIAFARFCADIAGLRWAKIRSMCLLRPPIASGSSARTGRPRIGARAVATVRAAGATRRSAAAMLATTAAT